ncbi:homoserine O-acetyltransferase [Capsaspora owczarzaki ATCC 30864]|uniref:Homoserine O-acetyltransferase n=1 Tax=Capsaspora owczarzaki (strain ATCC 30864) TaxID=595528 RepID=A0A0D2VH49_CAPO3|nr:homoserine O-acetyltransferase [Capsaspora owczarzaki ATCC 30864]KJE89257.1 homoserine O-acetyltransferase [Capsaspora owczarzaki ATCC 30864]|eukprot:XP_004365638.2 homoserine O-acetyltransferase [Capsaspora owczarzaki ATCC 30864]
MGFTIEQEHEFHVGDGVMLKQRRAVFDEFTLECGRVLRNVEVGFRTWGTLNPTRDNAIVVCHALTGHSDVSSWWAPILGEGKPLDTSVYFVICANVLGSPYGTASPLTINPDTQQPYGAAFPHVTIRDTVRLHRRLVQEALGVQRIFAVVGASLGGMQALEWGYFGTTVVAHLVLIACCGRQSAWCIGWSETQRQAIINDPKWRNGNYPLDDPPAQGLATARMIAMLTYRSSSSMEERFGRQVQDPAALPEKYRTDNAENDQYFFNIQSYLRYQGRKLVQRYDANCYMRLMQMMDTHDVARGRTLPAELAPTLAIQAHNPSRETPAASAAPSLTPREFAAIANKAYKEALAQLQQPALVVGVESDLLYTIAEQAEMSSHIAHAEFVAIPAYDGHDGFLVEFARLNEVLNGFLKRHEPRGC